MLYITWFSQDLAQDQPQLLKSVHRRKVDVEVVDLTAHSDEDDERSDYSECYAY